MPGSRKRLRKARRTRTQIAQVFVALEMGKLHAGHVLGTPIPCLGRIRVYDVLRRFPHLDRSGAENVLRRAKVWPLTKMNELTEEERQRILIHLPPRVNR